MAAETDSHQHLPEVGRGHTVLYFLFLLNAVGKARGVARRVSAARRREAGAPRGRAALAGGPQAAEARGAAPAAAGPIASSSLGSGQEAGGSIPI